MIVDCVLSTAVTFSIRFGEWSKTTAERLPGCLSRAHERRNVIGEAFDWPGRMDDEYRAEHRVNARVETDTRTNVSVRGHEITIDEPPAGGGADEGPSPVETMLAAQAGCLNVAGTAVARDMDIDLRIREIDIGGGLDVRKIKGTSDEPRAGVQHLDVRIQIESDEDEETIQKWIHRTQERSPVTNNLLEETPCDLSYSVR